MASNLGDLSGFKTYADWQAANRAAGGTGDNPDVQAYFQGGQGGQGGGQAPQTQSTAPAATGPAPDDWLTRASKDKEFTSQADPSKDNSSQWLGKRKPTVPELRNWAAATGRSEDYERFSDAAINGWLNPPAGSKYGWNVAAGQFNNAYGDLVDKPDERGPNTPWNVNGTGDVGNYGEAGPGGGGQAAAAATPAQSPADAMQQKLIDMYQNRQGMFTGQANTGQALSGGGIFTGQQAGGAMPGLGGVTPGVVAAVGSGSGGPLSAGIKAPESPQTGGPDIASTLAGVVGGTGTGTTGTFQLGNAQKADTLETAGAPAATPVGGPNALAASLKKQYNPQMFWNPGAQGKGLQAV